MQTSVTTCTQLHTHITQPRVLSHGESSVWEEGGHSSVHSASATLDKERAVGVPFVTYAVASELRSQQHP